LVYNDHIKNVKVGIMKKQALILFAIFFLLASICHANQSEDGVPLCPSDQIICRVVRNWTSAELQTEVGTLAASDSAFFTDGLSLVFVYRLSDRTYNRVAALLPVVLSASMPETPMQRVEDTEQWTLTLQFEGIDQAMISFYVVERGNSGDSMHPAGTWRGENAPRPVLRNEIIDGSYTVIPFESVSLGERRNIHLYLPANYDASQHYPVVYMADGQSLEDYAPMVDYLIGHGDIPPLIVVGIASGGFQNNVNLRGQEYVHGRNPERYERHRIFFNEEVRLWAEANYGASTERQDRVIFGISNGGLYAVAMNLHYPELYGTVFAFSAGASLGFEALEIESDKLELPLRVYGVAGTLEPIFHQSTSAFVLSYSQAGAESIFIDHVAGHEGAMWEVELNKALLWCFQS
jgi:enterochelin esterase-like enzyme